MLLFLDVAVDQAEAPADDHSGDHTNQTRKDEGVVDHELADVGRTGAVERQSSKVRRVGRQDVVTVGGGGHGNDHTGRRTNTDSNTLPLYFNVGDKVVVMRMDKGKRYLLWDKVG